MTLAATRTRPAQQPRPKRWPLLRQAPGRMLHNGVLAGMILLSVALLTALVTAGPLFASATAFGTLVRGLDALPPVSAPATGPKLEVTVNGPVRGEEAQIRSVVSDVPYLGEPQTTIFANAWKVEKKFTVKPYIRNGSNRAQALLYHRTGAIESLQIADGKRGTPGLWLPEGFAETLGVGPGSPVEVGKYYPDRAPGMGFPPDTATRLTVAGTYKTRPDGRTPLGAVFTGGSMPTDSAGSLLPATLLIGDLATVSQAITDTEETPLLSYTAELAPEGRDPAHLSQTASAIKDLELKVADPTDLTSLLLRTGQEESSVRSGLPAIQERTAGDAEAARLQGRAIAIAGAALGLAAMVMALRALGQRRLRETEFLVGVGAPTAGVILAGVLELLLPALFGAALGLALTCLAFSRFGPHPGLDAEAVVTASWLAGAVVGVALLSYALVTLGQVHLVSRRLSGLAPSRLGSQWLPLLTGATGLAVFATLTRDRGQSFQDPLSGLLPILVLACGCTLIIRSAGLLRLLLRRSRSQKALTNKGRFRTDAMVAKGLRGTGVAVTDLVVVLSIGIGVLAYGLVAAQSVDRAVTDKVASLAGARSSASLQYSWLIGGGDGPAPDLPEGTTVVWRAAGQFMGSNRPYDVLVINPPALREAATWGSGPDLAAAKEALADFGRPNPKARTTPVLMIGPADPDIPVQAVFESGITTQPVSIVRRLDAFPGSTRPTVVFDARSLFPKMLPEANPSLHTEAADYYDLASSFQTWVWTRESMTSLLETMSQHEVPVKETMSIELAQATPALLSARWAASYQELLGLAAAALAGLALVVAVDRRVAQAAATDLILKRFGFKPARLLRLRTLELAATCCAALLVLIGPLVLMAALIPRLTDPRPDLLPSMHFYLPTTPLLLSIAAAVAISAIAALAAARRSASIKPGEVLRDDA